MQVKDHARKERRDARKNPNKRKKLSKDPGIPNLCPFKEDLINRVRNNRWHDTRQTMLSFPDACLPPLNTDEKVQ